MVNAHDSISWTTAVNTELTKIAEQHARDTSAAAEARKNERLDRVEQQLYDLNEEIRFGNLSVDHKAFKVSRKDELLQLQQNIKEGIE